MSDPRFARFKTDPRFRRVKKDKAKVVVDDRFKSVFDADKKKKGDKSAKGRVDKYGRPLTDTHEADTLRRFYRLENEEEPAADDVQSAAPIDYARGAVLLESSDEEDNDANDDDSDTASVIALGRDISTPIPVLEEEPEIDLDEDSYADLDAQAAAYAKSHPENKIPAIDRTRRLAVVNLDWDHVRAIHLYKIFSSLVSPTASASASASNGKQKTSAAPVVRGKVLSVRVYPSEFGKERMAREEKEGPPPEVFKKSGVQEDEEVNERNIYETGDGEDYDEDMLRKYQLERLRYYYAIVECDSVEAASHIYTELEGTELERSANVFDLSFVPEEMSFDDEFRDEATGDVDAPFTAPEFVTDALRHSKVKLTWDEDDPERNLLTRRTLSRKEIEENDFRAYIASSSGSEDEDEPAKGKSKASSSREKLRSLLLSGGDDALPEGWAKDADGDGGSDIDMEITFTPGLSGNQDPGRDETTLEKYQRKMKEKRKRKKEAVKSGAQEPALGQEDDFFAAESDEDEDGGEETRGAHGKGKKGGKKKDTTVDEDARPVATAEELALLAVSDDPNKEKKHFDMKAILKAEKGGKGKKRRMRQKKGEAENELQEDFTIDVEDERFSAVHEDHTFAIDPSNPHFKKSKNMAALLNERSKRQKEKRSTVPAQEEPSIKNGSSSSQGHTDLMKLVESVKRKSAVVDTNTGKRRKVS